MGLILLGGAEAITAPPADGRTRTLELDKSIHLPAWIVGHSREDLSLEALAQRARPLLAAISSHNLDD
jgi:hypothetical protein